MDFCLVEEAAAAAGRAAFAGVRAAAAALSLGIVIQRRPSTAMEQRSKRRRKRSAAQERQQDGQLFRNGRETRRVSMEEATFKRGTAKEVITQQPNGELRTQQDDMGLLSRAHGRPRECGHGPLQEERREETQMHRVAIASELDNCCRLALSRVKWRQIPRRTVYIRYTLYPLKQVQYVLCAGEAT